MLPTVSSSSQSQDRFALEIDFDNKSYNVFDLNIKCSHEALKTFHRCSDAILERDPELYNIWIDDHRFYSHAILEVIENELNSLHYKCLYSHLRPLQGFRWLEGLLLVMGSYSKYLQELNNNERLDALLNLFYAAWITFFIHNRYAILQLVCPTPATDANNNTDDDSLVIENPEKKMPNKSNEQIVRYLEKYLPNFDRIIDEVIDLGRQLSSKRLLNLEKFEELYQLWKRPRSTRKRHSLGEFSLIIKRISSEVISSDFDLSSPTKSIDWKMIFYDEFLRYADRFDLMKNTLPSKRRTIGGERFSINKWSNNKINYFLTKNLLKRNSNNEYEKQIEQLYQ